MIKDPNMIHYQHANTDCVCFMQLWVCCHLCFALSYLLIPRRQQISKKGPQKLLSHAACVLECHREPGV